MEALNTHVRVIGAEDTIEPAYIRQKLARKLDKYGRSIDESPCELPTTTGLEAARISDAVSRLC